MATSILDKSFKYVHSSQTNLHVTFARVRREMKKKAEAEARERGQKLVSIRPIREVK